MTREEATTYMKQQAEKAMADLRQPGFQLSNGDATRIATVIDQLLTEVVILNAKLKIKEAGA